MNTDRKLHGGTTVSATALLAAKAGIKIFATGGLGGVHRNGENTMDVSADLTELGRTNIAVVSSGCKGFLDIPRTLEYLETQGVGVITMADGREGRIDFPAFWSRESGVRSPLVVQNEQEAAAVICEWNDIPGAQRRSLIRNDCQSHTKISVSVPAYYSRILFPRTLLFQFMKWTLL